MCYTVAIATFIPVTEFDLRLSEEIGVLMNCEELAYRLFSHTFSWYSRFPSLDGSQQRHLPSLSWMNIKRPLASFNFGTTPSLCCPKPMSAPALVLSAHGHQQPTFQGIQLSFHYQDPHRMLQRDQFKGKTHQLIQEGHHLLKTEQTDLKSDG